jgi:hypothetical protein
MPSCDVLWETRTLVMMLVIVAVGGVAAGMLISLLVLVD